MTNKSCNILVVEDRADWQDILCTTLARQGYTPRSAGSYQEALNRLDLEKFDLAVIDPVLDTANRFNRDGLSVIQKIRDTEPSLPVIIITGSLTHDMEISLEHLYPNASVLFKEKWDAKEFMSLVAEIIGRQPQTEPILPDDGQDSRHTGIRLFPTTPPAEHTIRRPPILPVENR